MVLDGNVDPREVWYEANLDQDVAFDKNIKMCFDWIAKHDDVYHLGTDRRRRSRSSTTPSSRSCARPRPAARSARTSGTTSSSRPATTSTAGRTSRQAFADWVNDGDLAAGSRYYDDPTGPGDGQQLRRSTWRSSAPTCSGRSGWDKWSKDNWRLHDGAVPDLGQRLVQRALPVLGRPRRHAGQGQRARRCRRILLIGETNDAATPFAGSLEVRKRFPQLGR